MIKKPSCRLKTKMQENELDALITMGRGITHDCNNLLTAIQGNTFIIKNSLNNKKAIESSIAQIENCTTRASELLTKISTYTGKAPLNKKTIDINKLIKTTHTKISQPYIQIPPIKFNFKKPIPKINADSEKLENMLKCLITNAAEAMIERQGNITITTGVIKKKDTKNIELTYPNNLNDTDYIFIRIKDSGKGMTIKMQKKIFTPFFTTKIRGEGLGLSVVLGIIRAHNGGIIADSHIHKGSTFTVIIPI